MNKIKYTITVIVILVATMIIYCAERIGDGVRNGIDLCINSVIPSLFLFSVISIFIINAEIFSNNKLIDFISYILFGLRGEIGAVSLISTIGGYPIGATMLNELYNKGSISKTSARTSLNFCINPGPAFIIGMVGNGIYHNQAIGIIIFFSSLIATSICSRLNRKKIILTEQIRNTIQLNYIDLFLKSVKASVRNIGIICGWVIVATAISEVVLYLNLPSVLGCFLEVTSGVITASNISTIYFVAFLIGFGGIAVHLQAISSASSLSPKYSQIFTWKFFQGLVTSGITFILLKLFPQTLSVSSNPTDIKMTYTNGNIFSAVITILFIMCTLIFLNQNVNRCRNFKKYVI